MTGLYPLLFEDLLKEKVWGGRRMETVLNRALPPGIPVGESWEISDHGADTSVIANGAFAGRTLHDLMEDRGTALLGTAVAGSLNRGVFPLLIKFLDASDRLSVQVHPDDAYAAAHEGHTEPGKTECWYVLHAEPDARLIVGVKEGTAPAAFRQGIETGALEQYLATVPVKAGDFVYIPAGTLHAIMEGIVLCEIQQNSDTTYRVFDWNRTGLDGKPRQLHVERSMDTIAFGRPPAAVTAGVTQQLDAGSITTFAACPYFAVQRLRLTAPLAAGCDGRRFVCLSVTGGTAVVSYESGAVPVPAGRSVLLPAALAKAAIAPLDGTCEVIRSFVPDIDRDIAAPLSAAGISRSAIDAVIHP